MTRKHYQLIAEELNAALELNRSEDRVALNATLRIIEGLATVLKRDNSNFDRFKFYHACGVKTEDNLNSGKHLI